MLNNKTIQQLNDCVNYKSYKVTWAYRKFVNCSCKIIGLFCGNQSFKTSATARQYVDRILGVHPVPKKNVVYFECERRVKYKLNEIPVEDLLKNHKSIDSATWKVAKLPKDLICPECGGKVGQHKRGSRVFRFCSETLPGQSANISIDGQSAEVKNTQYPEFKKWLPKWLIKKDITARNASMIVKDVYGGMDIITEFVSYNQSVQSTAGPQRMSIWCVAKGQRVLMSNGIWRNIESIKSGDELISEALGGHGTRQRVNNVKTIINNGTRDVYRFKCQKGISFDVTEDHLIMIPTLGRASYKKSKYLSIGDNVTCKLSNISGNDTLEDWQLILTAVLIGDGCITGKRQVKFTCKNIELAKKIEEILPSFLSFRIQEYKDDHAPDYYIKSTNQYNNPLVNFLKEVKLWGKKSKEKFIPDIVFVQSNKKISLFLRFLYATDGWASGHCIGYCSTSCRLTQDIFLLLRRLGIRSITTKKEFANNWNTQWWVIIAQSHDVLNFINNVGIEAKSGFTDKVKLEAKRRVKSRFDVCVFPNKSMQIKKILKQNVKIKSIEYIGKKEVYDIVMDKPKREDGAKLNNFLIQGGVVVHNCDEEADEDFIEEQRPRLIAEDGDMIHSCTPANRMTHLFDSVYEKARVIYRTPEVVQAYKKYLNQDVENIEHTDRTEDIAVIQTATDDNPTLSKDAIEALFDDVDDITALIIRRYGIFKQVSGCIFKSFHWKTHVINFDKYFPAGIPKDDYVHAQGIDYHQHNPWADMFMSISPRNEVFIWWEDDPSPETNITMDIARTMAKAGSGYKFRISVADALAATKQPNTGTSVIDDLNRYFWVYSREGLCNSASWRSWDTKSTRGRDEVRKRLKNSLLVGKPFSNYVEKGGKEQYLPTLWVSDRCPKVARSLKNWRLKERKAIDGTKDPDETPQQKWSHFCTTIECIFKEVAFRPKVLRPDRPRSKDNYFQGRV